MEGAIRQSSHASALFIASGGTRAIVSIAQKQPFLLSLYVFTMQHFWDYHTHITSASLFCC